MHLLRSVLKDNFGILAVFLLQAFSVAMFLALLGLL